MSFTILSENVRSRTKVGVVTAMVLCALLGLASCGTAPGSSTGRVAGFVTQQGGPVGVDGTSNNSPQPAQAVITAQAVGGTGSTYSATADSTGWFALDVPPGTYQVTARYHPEDQGSSQQVVVTAGQTATLSFTFNLP